MHLEVTTLKIKWTRVIIWRSLLHFQIDFSANSILLANKKNHNWTPTVLLIVYFAKGLKTCPNFLTEEIFKFKKSYHDEIIFWLGRKSLRITDFEIRWHPITMCTEKGSKREEKGSKVSKNPSTWTPLLTWVVTVQIERNHKSRFSE